MRDVGTAKSLELAALSPVIDAIKSEIFKKVCRRYSKAELWTPLLGRTVPICNSMDS